MLKLNCCCDVDGLWSRDSVVKHNKKPFRWVVFCLWPSFVRLSSWGVYYWFNCNELWMIFLVQYWKQKKDLSRVRWKLSELSLKVQWNSSKFFNIFDQRHKNLIRHSQIRTDRKHPTNFSSDCFEMSDWTRHPKVRRLILNYPVKRVLRFALSELFSSFSSADE